MMDIDHFFSTEFKNVIANSRLIAIDLGYDHISTVHFFLADCESGRPNSIFNFAFNEREEYLTFKEQCKVKHDNWLAISESDIPLTTEAEKAIFRTDTERINHQQSLSLPCHFFLAAFDNPDSVLFFCFKDTKDVKQLLEAYYRQLGEFEKYKLIQEQVPGAPAQKDSTVKKKWYEIWK